MGVTEEYEESEWGQEIHSQEIFLNWRLSAIVDSTERTLGVLLHEMGHAFLNRYSAWDQWVWKGEEDDDEKEVDDNNNNNNNRESVKFSNLGCTGHGRAWQVLVKGIEDHMGLLLGFRVRLGRLDGLAEEVRDGGSVPCRKQAEELYECLGRFGMWRDTMRGQGRVEDCCAVYYEVTFPPALIHDRILESLGESLVNGGI